MVSFVVSEAVRGGRSGGPAWRNERRGLASAPDGVGRPRGSDLDDARYDHQPPRQ
jgi:hypothetical protein